MKVLFTFGGLPHYYNFVLNRLNKLPGTEIKVIVPSNKGTSLGKGVHESSEGVEFGVIPLEEKKAWYGKPFFKDFVKTIASEKPDLIVTIWPYVLGFALKSSWRKAKKRYGFRLIYKDIPFNIPIYQESLKYYRNHLNLENLDGKSGKWGIKQIIYYNILKQIIKNYLRRMEAHVYYTEDAYNIITSYGVKRESIFITYNSPDTDHLFEIRSRMESITDTPAENKKIVLHIGRLVAWKKADILIQAFNIVLKTHPESELWIIGDGPESERLNMLVHELGIENRVDFKGAIYDPDVLGKLTINATIYVLAGMGGLSINEAMAMGKPVICTRADGTEKKLVRDNINGYYFKEDDVHDLSVKIESLLSDPEKVKAFGKESTNIIKNEVNIHVVIDGYRRAFEYALKHHSHDSVP